MTDPHDPATALAAIAREAARMAQQVIRAGAYFHNAQTRATALVVEAIANASLLSAHGATPPPPPPPTGNGWLTMPASVARSLADASPRLEVSRPTLVTCPDSKSGYLLVVPTTPKES